MSSRYLALWVLATGCTATHSVTLPPLTSQYPVSASAQYVNQDGTTVGAEDYRVVSPFEIVKRDRSDSNHFRSTLQLGPEIDRLVRAANGDAVTNLRVEATSFGTHQNLGTILGVSLGIVGSVLVVQDLASGSDQDPRSNPVFWTGTACFISGAVLYLVGDYTKATSWQFHVSGQVVRSQPGPAPLSAPAPTTEPISP